MLSSFLFNPVFIIVIYNFNNYFGINLKIKNNAHVENKKVFLNLDCRIKRM